MPTATETPSRSGTSLVRRGLIAVVLSVVANAVLLVVAQATRIAPDFRPLAWPPVVFLTVVGAVGAVAVYWLLSRWADDPDRTFTLVAGVVLVLSFVPDLFLLSADENATVLGVVVLMAMHVTVAAICVGVLTRGEGVLSGGGSA
jgi:uncharacterized membrane protein